jgi:hypothetical protein
MKISHVIALSSVSAMFGGLGCGFIATGYAQISGSKNVFQIALIGLGFGIILGFLWGAIVWADRVEPREVPPKKSYELQSIRVELRESNDGYAQVQWVQLPEGISMEQLRFVADKVVLHNAAFGHSLCNRYGSISRPQFEALRDLFIERGWARWNNPKAHARGVIITPAGKAILKRFTTPPRGSASEAERIDRAKHAHASTHDSGAL